MLETKGDQPSPFYWGEAYIELLAYQKERGLAACEDDPSICQRITSKFLQIFNAAPHEHKKYLASAPLYPAEVGLTPEQIATRRPLNYIMFTANKLALKALAPFLTDEDWLRRGPFDSSYVHCVIAGMLKNATHDGQPITCIKMILKRHPTLATQKNVYGTTPERFLDYTIGMLKAYPSNVPGAVVNLQKVQLLRAIIRLNPENFPNW